MQSKNLENVWNLPVPWSDGSLSARLWQKGKGVMVSVPELDICCYGKSQSEAVLRLFTNLLKYYNELKEKDKLSDRQETHFKLLKVWVKGVEKKMCAGEVLHSL
jgi:hypothetical protein